MSANGVILLNKHAGISSNQIDQKIKKILSLGKTKIGHIGTLDPLAKGILPVIIGNDSTKFINYVDDKIKTYEFRVKFGYKSSTGDSEGYIKKQDLYLQITSKDIELFYKCYSNTIKKKWSIHYLNQLFFEKLVESNLKNQMVIIQAFKEDIFLGCSLHFIGDNTLYGRYWGALQEVPFLHFELCYYQAIEFAIQNKLSKVEAGAQGEHKISRGYIPELTYSNHWFGSQELKESINIFFFEEGKKVKETIEYLKKLSPFKN